MMIRIRKKFLYSFMLITGLLLTDNQVLSQANPDRIERLITQGKLNEALVLTDEQLAGDSDNVNYLFLKGLILTRQDRLEQAKEIFIRLTENHPELPEPFNNLAVIYAAQGDYNNARMALQNAINTHPSYATAHENLGDIFAKMASRAYNQALELDEANETAREKLLLVNDLFSADTSRQEGIIPANTREADKISDELVALEKALNETRNKVNQESALADAIRREVKSLQEERNKIIEELQKNQLQAEKEASEALEKAELAKEQLSRLEQQAGRSIEQVRVEQQDADRQLLRTQNEIATMKAELNELTAKRDAFIEQTEDEQALAEKQLQQLRMEIAGLEQTREELTESVRRDAAEAEEKLSQTRTREQKTRAEITKIEQQRLESINQAESDRRQILARVETGRQELEDIKAELAGLQRQKEELENQNRMEMAKLDNTMQAAAETDRMPMPGKTDGELIDAVKYWSGKWSDKDIEGYLSSYSTDFRPSDGMSRASWAIQRRERLRTPRYIRVDVDNFRIRFKGEQRAQVLFDQSYQSDTYSDKVEKILEMQYENGRWLILEEKSN